MEKIFYTDADKFPSSIEAVSYLLSEFFKIENPAVAKTEHGKPYLLGENVIRFSVSHTKSKLFIAFCDKEVGIDAELLDRKVRLPLLLKNFPQEEQKEILSETDFLLRWTIKESAVKWLGGTLSRDLKNMLYLDGKLYLSGRELPVKITRLSLDGHTIAVCSEQDFSTAEPILF